MTYKHIIFFFCLWDLFGNTGKKQHLVVSSIPKMVNSLICQQVYNNQTAKSITKTKLFVMMKTYFAIKAPVKLHLCVQWLIFVQLLRFQATLPSYTHGIHSFICNIRLATAAGGTELLCIVGLSI